MKEKKLLDRAAFPASHWKYLKHTTLSSSSTGRVSIAGDWASRFSLILAAVHQQAGVHLLVTLLPSFPLVLLS